MAVSKKKSIELLTVLDWLIANDEDNTKRLDGKTTRSLYFKFKNDYIIRYSDHVATTSKYNITVIRSGNFYIITNKSNGRLQVFENDNETISFLKFWIKQLEFNDANQHACHLEEITNYIKINLEK